MPTTDITVEKRSDDYRAWLADSPGVWESGKSEAEALGKLVISAQNMLAIHVDRFKAKGVK
jgi:predicted RNase H-like HicB family nuclease